MIVVYVLHSCDEGHTQAFSHCCEITIAFPAVRYGNSNVLNVLHCLAERIMSSAKDEMEWMQVHQAAENGNDGEIQSATHSVTTLFGLT